MMDGEVGGCICVFLVLFYSPAGFLDILVILDEKGGRGRGWLPMYSLERHRSLDLGCLLLRSIWGGCKEKFPGFILEYSDGFIEYILSTCNHSCYDIRLKNVAVDWMSENEGLSDVLPVVRSSHTI
jgi:hypothetical protein